MSNHLEHDDFAEKPRRPIFRPILSILISGLAALCLIPLGFITGLSNPRLLEWITMGFPPTWPGTLAGVAIACLVMIPMIWIARSGSLDLIAFFLMWEALIMCGFFFLGITAWNLEGGLGQGILSTAPLVVLINCTGFAILLTVLGCTYSFLKSFGFRSKSIAPIVAGNDGRLKWFLRGIGFVTILLLALPMARTGIVPLLAYASDGAGGTAFGSVDPRLMLIESPALRAIYNLGYGLMPFVTAGLILYCIRKPIQFLKIDGIIIAILLIAQLLSGNRFPLALAAIATISLLSMERRIPRWILITAIVMYMFLFTVLGGFTGLLRWDKEQLFTGNPVSNSIEAAFTGNNLIDMRDASWVMSQWDFEPLNGMTYLGGLTSFIPSGIFPQKREWHLGLTAVRLVGWDDSTHPGLRISFFGESFLNFGLAGVITLGTVLGILFGSLLWVFHQASAARPPSLNRNLRILILMEMTLHLSNTSNAFSFWALGAILLIQWILVDCFAPPVPVDHE